jgi:hypothetical protein
MLDDLYAETERLLREKEPAIHHLAKALIERDELIGDELEEVFAEVERAHPELREKFERKIIPFRDFAPAERQIVESWTPQPAPQDAAASDAPAASEGAVAAPGVSAIDAAGVAGWLPPPPGSSRDRNRGSGGPGMPTNVVPPWAGGPNH